MGNSRITGPLFKWFGSKWLSAPKYPKPEFRDLYEPFAGSAGYALRHSHLNVTIYDTDVYVASLWKWLINEADYKSIMSIPVDIPEGTSIHSLELSGGQSLLLKHWQRTNNVGECWTISPWGNKPGQWTKSTRERVAREVEHIKHWKFAPVAFDQPGTYFVDPPYLYNFKYLDTMFSHQKMAWQVKCLPLPNQVIACEAVCTKTGRVPAYLDFKPFRESVTSRRKEGCSTHSKELIYHSIHRKEIKWDW